MDTERSLYVGIDFEKDYTQASCRGKGMSQPESVSAVAEKSRYRLPAVLYYKKSTGEWLFGEEAYKYRDFNDGGYVDDLLGKAERNENVTIFGNVISPITLLERYLKKLMYMIKKKYPQELIKKLVITSKSNSERVQKQLLQAFERLGLMEDRVFFLNNIDCFMYYTVSQHKDLWLNDVGMFDFSQEGLSFYRLSFGRKRTPIVVSYDRTDFDDVISYNMLDKDKLGRLTYSFENVSASVLHKQIISSIYVTGSGFEGSWADDILKSWCLSRRVFKGQNLYSKGACYAAAILTEDAAEEFLFLNEDMIKATLGFKVYHDSKQDEIILAQAGEKWSEINSTIEVILDQTDELDFVIRNLMKKDYICAIMSVDGLPKREPKTIRLQINVMFHDKETVVVTVRDTGFGEFYPTSHRIWEYIFKI